VFNTEEKDFVISLIDKELAFEPFGEVPNDLLQVVRYYVAWEKEKLEDRSIGSEDYEGDIAIANSILSKMKTEVSSKGGEQ
jgi:hypothetical protein